MSADWSEFQLGERCTVKSSRRIFAHEYVEKGIPFMRSKDVIDKSLGVFVNYDLYISEERFLDIKKTYGSPVKGDVLMSSVGNRSGQPYVIQDEGDFHFKDGNILWLSEFDDINPDYLAYWLKSEIGQNALASVMIGSAQKALTISSIRNLWVRFPPIKYQNSVVDILLSLDSKVELNRQINQTLEQIAQAIFKSWFVDFEPTRAKIIAKEQGANPATQELAAQAIICGAITLEQLEEIEQNLETTLQNAINEKLTQDNQAPINAEQLKATAALFPNEMVGLGSGEVPESWGIGMLADIAEFQNGYAFKSKDWAEAGYPVVKIGSVKPGFVELDSCSYVDESTVVGLERFELNAGDVLVGMTGYPGETGLVPITNTRVFLNQRVGRFTPKSKELKSFVYCNVRASSFKQYVEGQAHGSAQANVSGRSIKEYPVILPSKAILEEFDKITNPLVSKLLRLNAQSQFLAETRDALLPKLLSGELVVIDNPAPAIKDEEALNV